MSEQDKPPAIGWVPVLCDPDEFMETMPLTTFGIGSDHEDEGVPVPEAGGAVIDRDIAELVALLNRAGIRTFQSCHDIRHGAVVGPQEVGWAEGEDEDVDYFMLEDAGEAGRYGCIVVEWAEFPKVGPVLPR